MQRRLGESLSLVLALRCVVIYCVSNYTDHSLILSLPTVSLMLLCILQLPAIEQSVKQAGQTILTPLVSLDTPGKATVEVVILADPVSQGEDISLLPPCCLFSLCTNVFFAHLKDGHEICFVGDEAFRELSQMDPSADDLITKVVPPLSLVPGLLSSFRHL